MIREAGGLKVNLDIRLEATESSWEKYPKKGFNGKKEEASRKDGKLDKGGERKEEGEGFGKRWT